MPIQGKAEREDEEDSLLFRSLGFSPKELASAYINGKLSKAFYREINEYDCHDIFDWFVVCCIRREEEYATEHPEEYEDWNANISGWNMFCDFMSGKAQYEERYL